MQTEIESNEAISEQMESRMDLLEQKIAGVVGTVSRLKSENKKLAEERDSLADDVKQYREKIAALDAEAPRTRIDELVEENKLLLRERESIARRVGELLDKLDLLST